jgi:4-amino-4-deoxy-L-arabinose transferase-like glycosyltransferase
MPWLARHRELALLAVWLLALLGLRPLMLPDEGRYATVAFEMLDGSPLVPLLNGLPFFHKPPLLYWLDQAAMAVFGVNAFAARLGPACMAWCLGAGLFLHLRHWHGQAVARASLAVLATSPLYFVGAQYVNHDMGVAACIVLSVLAFARALAEQGAARRRWLLAGWALCGLGVLAKGLIGIVLPLAVLVPWLLAQRRWTDLLALASWRGVLAFVAVAGPWLLLMQWRYPGFLDYFIVEQHFRRYAGAHFNNQEPLWFFWVVLPLLMLPWTLWLWPALRQSGWQAALYLWWTALVLLFFSLPQSKLVGYAMPAMAPLAALLGLVLAQRTRLRQRLLFGAALACAALVAGLAWKPPPSHADLGLALRERWQAGDRLVFADASFYDLRFVARIAQPAIVLSDWGDPQQPRADNWQKELLDAARFDHARGQALLWDWQQLAAVPCHGGTVWLVTSEQALPRLATLGAQTVFAGRQGLLLRVAGRACAAPLPP